MENALIGPKWAVVLFPFLGKVHFVVHPCSNVPLSRLKTSKMRSCFSEVPDLLSIIGTLLVMAGTVVVAKAS